MVQINKVNANGFVAYDVYINGVLHSRCNNYYDAVAVTILLVYNKTMKKLSIELLQAMLFVAITFGPAFYWFLKG